MLTEAKASSRKARALNCLILANKQHLDDWVSYHVVLRKLLVSIKTLLVVTPGEGAVLFGVFASGWGSSDVVFPGADT